MTSRRFSSSVLVISVRVHIGDALWRGESQRCGRREREWDELMNLPVNAAARRGVAQRARLSSERVAIPTFGVLSRESCAEANPQLNFLDAKPRKPKVILLLSLRLESTTTERRSVRANQRDSHGRNGGEMSTLSSGLASMSLASNGGATSQANRSANRGTNRFSALASLAAEQDTEIEDELARGQPNVPRSDPPAFRDTRGVLHCPQTTLYAARLP